MENNKNEIKVSLSKVKTSDEKILVPDKSAGIDKHIVTYYQPKGAIAEQYRTLRTRASPEIFIQVRSPCLNV